MSEIYHSGREPSICMSLVIRVRAAMEWCSSTVEDYGATNSHSSISGRLGKLTCKPLCHDGVESTDCTTHLPM